MAKRKEFASEDAIVVMSTTPVDVHDGGATVHLGENVRIPAIVTADSGRS